MQSWIHVWREGISPQLSRAQLEHLLHGLMVDDPRLLQGATTSPPPLQCVQDWPVEAACVIGYCGWQGEPLETVAEVEEFFARVCYDCDVRMGEPAACRWFINWADDTPRDDMRFALISEVKRSLALLPNGEANGYQVA